MLSRKAAAAELARYAVPEADRRWGGPVRGLLAPALAKDLVRAIEDTRLWQPVAEQLDALPLARRTKVISAVAPHLGAEISRWWEWSAGQAYQRGWARRAFRSPAPTDSLWARWQELRRLIRHAVQYPQPLSWHADWALHLHDHGVPLGSLFASAIAGGDTAIARSLVAAVRGEHPIGGPCADAFVGLLAAPDPAGWAEVTRLLVTAQRQEGLRQTILEAADLGHPDAFAAVLDAVAEHGLARFASTVRALGVWIGEELTVRQERQVTDAVGTLRRHLRRPPSGADLRDGDPAEAMLGLWALAVRDVGAAIAAAEQLQASSEERIRLAAARVLAEIRLPAARPALARAIADPALPVYAAAVAAWPAVLPYRAMQGDYEPPLPPAVRDALRARMDALGTTRDIETGLIGRLPRKVGSALAADVLISHPDGSPLDPGLLAAATVDGRLFAAYALSHDPERHRTGLLSLLVSDRAARVREQAAQALSSIDAFTEDEARLLEAALQRTTSDLRTAALTLLARQPAPAIVATVDRLAAGTDAQQRAAAELRRRSGASPEGVGGDARGAAGGSEVPPALRWTVAERTPARRPVPPPPSRWVPLHDRFRLTWTSLTAWLDEHADVEVRTDDGVQLLANLRWLRSRDGGLPIPEVLGPWWERIGPQLTDGGVEVELLGHLNRWLDRDEDPRWIRDVRRTVLGPVADEIAAVPPWGLRWAALHAVARHARRPSWADPLIDLVDQVAAALPVDRIYAPAAVLERRGRPVERDRWGENADRSDDRAAFRDLFGGVGLDPAALSDEQVGRLWRALRFVDEPEGTFDRWHGPTVMVARGDGHGAPGEAWAVPDQPGRWPVPARLLAEAVRRGHAVRGDLLDALVVPAAQVTAHHPPRPRAVGTFTGLRLEPWAADERIQSVVSLVRAAAVDDEVGRGDLPNALNATAQELRTVYGAADLVRLLRALGKGSFTRGYARASDRTSSLSHLVRVSQPLPQDTGAELGRLVVAAGITERRLVETALYAPQWARLIEEHLGWRGLESAVWWVHAHTKDDAWTVDQHVRAQWQSEVSQRTPLDAQDLLLGAADVTWFRETCALLGADRFAQVLKAAKFAASGAGHKRAELFATTLLGRTDPAALVERITSKRHQDSVRALGLLSLADDLDGRILLERYELLRGFVASDRTSGSQRRSSETAAVEIGLENLARTAGFRDPQRLVWAMEAEAVRDLAAGPLSAYDGDLEVRLAIVHGAPELTVNRAGRALRSVPAKSAKVPEIAALRDRARPLRQQISRMRASLEASCVLGEAFEPAELADLQRHPVLAPMLRDLVLVDGAGRVGFARPDGMLGAADGTARPATGSLRIAHPTDLLGSGEWPDLQHALMGAERRQPFKQLFRELYTLNDNERDDDGRASRRYDGHQVESRRAGGLFTARGWVADFEVGFSRTFHPLRITAWCHLLDGWGSAAEVEDATIRSVTFHHPGRWEPLPLAEVPPRVFSETMRDLDLVVSVAHSGGVDPEASESSIAVRARLVAETADLLGLTNLEVGGHHVRVKGALGTYSIHLGSGVVHRVPGNAICIVPVSAQHRGRIFLPFADEDPRTAEVVAKVVLLARDDRIKDPTILQQLVG
ncbi:DUF4132 domain-containing protein [Nocardioides sp. GY 10113]|uniref:DUF4132 domain-containing protein n=1 Tax=Nocardioides sp. GY 10113 TaxID=2569761 RepID=UPI0010A84A65|nr:DUF4132 domain-containing protein [Nocardioides sp. GY 10113]TIC89179.1 DUF4132 domain-containing protein [Nocardioides sp. GY 10113]